MICPKCEKSNKEEARFCAYCGEELIDISLDANDKAEDCVQIDSVENVNIQDNDESDSETEDSIVHESDDQVIEEKDDSEKVTTLSVPSEKNESLVATVSNNVKGFVAKYYPICKKYVISAASFCKEKNKSSY